MEIAVFMVLIVIVLALAYIMATGGGPSSGDPMGPGAGGAL